MVQVNIDKEKCVACGFCVGTCPTGVIDTDGDYAFVFRLDECNACRLCEDCPESAIQVREN